MRIPSASRDKFQSSDARMQFWSRVDEGPRGPVKLPDPQKMRPYDAERLLGLAQRMLLKGAI